MPAETFPVLWLCGPAGVGKSTVSWQLFTELAESGARAAFVDTDQVRMCYPAPPGDPGRQRVKALNVAGMIPGYRAAGARCLIANGDLDPVAGVQAELIPQTAVLVCRLRADWAAVERRYAARHGRQDDLDARLRQARAEASEMDLSTFADVCIDTTNRSAREVAAFVREECKHWPGFHAQRPGSAAPAGDADTADVDGQVMLITGPTGVGKSTIGFSFYLRCLNAGLTAGYVDLNQLGFVRPATADDPRGHGIKARNLGAIWRNYRAAGATHLVASGPVEDDAALRHYAAALSGTDITLCRLRAGAGELRGRVLSRGAGGSWPEPGDPLRGQSPAVLREVAAEAIEESHTLERTGPAGLTVDTDGWAPAQAADMIASAAGWPHRG
jgi:guanylate kinase